MESTIRWSDKIKLPNQSQFHQFLQKQANRLIVGHARYGSPEKRKKYLTRLKLEIKAYQKSGNMEHLINVANYCILESITPENAKFHFDNSVDSVTRDKNQGRHQPFEYDPT